MKPSMHYAWMQSPVGRLLVAGDAEGLRYILFADGREEVTPKDRWIEDTTALAEPIRQLTEYFAGTRRAFDLRLAPEGTAFQQRVWEELRRIPYGETRSYG